MQLVQLEAFKKEIVDFPIETKEDILSLIGVFLSGEHLNRNDFKTFKIDKNNRIQEFRVKDHRVQLESDFYDYSRSIPRVSLRLS